ncbi:divalent-cation tolerance protein CutA [Motilimonas pumila]|uniref:Divalent-cation tolerance protein CutA n=1 Tax=Motilimonas pumila TaxID=2303987 RepID=A0A418YL35_9GAMM|nr:divalent-cation tolerance protein CutA [Motilimonas pumila]RJG51681.1 divalent-cation tolerance protein CutA [Motilimonas pumila]
MNEDYIMVLCSAPDSTEAENIAEQILEQKLAACITMQPNVYSFYHWHGEVQKDREVLMMIKTRGQLFDELNQAIKRMHSYETPEIIALPVKDGDRQYLSWIDQVT